MSDWDGYAARLPRTLGYRNTFYDHEPRLDITAPVAEDLLESCDFIICTDVLEHTAPPYQRAVTHLREILKPGGTLVLTVPMRAAGPTEEHFPDLYEFEIVTSGPEPVLVNRTVSGEVQTFGDLVFHGGTGATLEMRVCSLPDVLDSLNGAGFANVQTFDQPVPEHGIIWNEGTEWPIVANR